jgi:hypothetical protein
MKLDGKVALVIGAASDIGHGIAKRFVCRWKTGRTPNGVHNHHWDLPWLISASVAGA